MDPAPSPGMSPADGNALLGMIAAPERGLGDAHARFRVLPRRPSEIGPFRRGRRLSSTGCSKVISDAHGRPTFELYRFERQAVP
jgi:hypothetical protein